MVFNVSFWICGTGILQPKIQHHPQESYSSGSHPAQGRSARHAIHSRKAREDNLAYPLQNPPPPPKQSASVRKTGSPESQLPACGTVSS